jgi:hypothetical protein
VIVVLLLSYHTIYSHATILSTPHTALPAMSYSSSTSANFLAKIKTLTTVNDELTRELIATKKALHQLENRCKFGKNKMVSRCDSLSSSLRYQSRNIDELHRENESLCNDNGEMAVICAEIIAEREELWRINEELMIENECLRSVNDTMRSEM